jgi:hypothetical protein
MNIVTAQSADVEGLRLRERAGVLDFAQLLPPGVREVFQEPSKRLLHVDDWPEDLPAP